MRLSNLPVRIEYLMGTLLIALGIISIYGVSGDLEHNSLYALSKVVMIVLGILIIIDPKKNVMRATGMYAATIGMGGMIRSINALSSESTLYFLFGLITFLLGVNLVLCGVSYFRGTSKNARRMTMTAYLIFLIYCLRAIATIYLGTNPWEYFTNNYTVVTFLIMYAMYIFVLTSDEIRYGIPLEKNLIDLTGLRKSISIPNDSLITESDLKAISDGLAGTASWNKLNSGPAESEYMIKLGKEMPCTLILQKWKGSTCLYATVVTDPNGSFIQGARFRIDNMIRDKETAILYGNDGSKINIKIDIERKINEDRS